MPPNYIHPFRQLDWRPVHGEENHAAARAGSDDDDLAPLITMFEKVVAPADAHEPYRAVTEIRRLSIARAEKS